MVGLTQATAESTLGAVGLTVGTISSAYSATVPAGNVIRQSPTAGTSIADGSRQATLLIPQGTQAQVLLPDGSTRAVSTLTLAADGVHRGTQRAQEDARPAAANSAYTYAVEIGADQAVAKIGGKDVLLSQPVFFYVENFLNFPVGETVPMGYYDNSRGMWVASDSGQVIEILNIASGQANLDTDGDGVADTGLGITEAEQQQLAALYPAGHRLWGIPIPIFPTGIPT